jgi:hypothetical protein
VRRAAGAAECEGRRSDGAIAPTSYRISGTKFPLFLKALSTASCRLRSTAFEMGMNMGKADYLAKNSMISIIDRFGRNS